MAAAHRTGMRNSLPLLALVAALVACTHDNTIDTNLAANEGAQLGQDNAVLAENMFATQPDPIVVIGESGTILLTIDEAEITQAQQALSLTAAPVAVEFAQRMIDDHTAHRASTLDVLASYHAPQIPNPVSAQLQREATQAMADLNAASEPAYDYMRQQVVMHNEAIVIVDKLRDHAPDANFDAFLADTRAMLDAHRIAAESDLRND